MIKLCGTDFWRNPPDKLGGFEGILRKWFDFEIDYDNPDYVICGPYGYDCLKYSCPRIFVTGECISPDFNIYDYALGFDNISFGDRYRRLPLWFLYTDAIGRASQKHLLTQENLLNRDFCSIVVSSQKSRVREDFFYMLSEYKHIDSGGRWNNNVGGPVDHKMNFQQGYKFSIAFENSMYDGYITEKIVEAWGAGTIPIYWGAKDVVSEFNPKAFINCNDFFSFEEVREYVIKLDNDDTSYLNMMKEPVFVPGSRSYDDYLGLENNTIKEFFEEIFSSRGTIRRNVSFWGSRYEDNRDLISYMENIDIKWRVPDIVWKKNIILYGKGGMGVDLYNQISRNKDTTIVKWIDSNDDVLANISGCEYDLILIAIGTESIRRQIAEKLLTCGINKDKIYSLSPIRLGS